MISNEILPNLVILLLEKTTPKTELNYWLRNLKPWIAAIKPKHVTIQKCLSKEFENSKKSKPDKTKELKIQILKSKFEKSLNPNPMLIVKTKLKAKNSKPRTKYQT